MSAAPPSLAAAISPGGLFAREFAGPSWDRWRAVLRAVNGEPLSDAEGALFAEVAGGRAPPPRRVRELWAVIGRRGGKDSIAAAIAVVLALADHSQHLRPGELGTVLCVATTKEQAGVIFRYIRGLIDASPVLRDLVERESLESITLRTGAEIVVTSPNFRVVRGRTVIAAILDEVAYYGDDAAALSANELYNAIRPAMVTIPTALMIGISSPHGRSGLLFEKWSASFGKGDPDALVVHGPTRAFNPLIDQKIIDDALARDPERAAAEWLAEWRGDVGDFLDRELVDSATDRDVIARPPVAGIRYVAGADPSGGRADSFAVAIAHAEGDVAVLDALLERRAPFDPTSVVAEAAALLRAYGVAEVTGDRFAGAWPAEAFAREGISYQPAACDKSTTYVDTLPLFASGRVRLLDHARLAHQLTALERRTTRGGRDKIDHPRGGHDDMAVAAALALVQAARGAEPALIKATSLLGPDGRPVPARGHAHFLFATVHVGDDGTAAVAIFDQHPHSSPEVLVLDYRLRHVDAGLFFEAERLLLQHRPRYRVCPVTTIWAPKALIATIPHPDLVELARMPEDWIADPEALALGASIHIAAGRVRVCETAAAAGPELAIALEIRLSTALDPNVPLRGAVLLGTRAAFG